MNAILVSVDYSDLLAITLPYNRHHFNRVMVVTRPNDFHNVFPIAQANQAVVYTTDAFYRDGAVFNKWAALEEGLTWMGREGWICIMDADVLWPKKLIVHREGELLGLGIPVLGGAEHGIILRTGQLCTPRRRMWRSWPDNPLPIRLSDFWLGGHRAPGEEHWEEFPLHRNEVEFAGYSQIFHADDPVLGSPPWHQTNWKHAGGADSFFQAKWVQANKIRPPFEVLHLGPAGQNWCGRATPYLDGTTPENAGEKIAQVGRFLRGRTYGPGRFDGEKILPSLPPPDPSKGNPPV
jgi:hypothetical protein